MSCPHCGQLPAKGAFSGISRHTLREQRYIVVPSRQAYYCRADSQLCLRVTVKGKVPHSSVLPALLYPLC